MLLHFFLACPSPLLESDQKCIRFINSIRLTFEAAKTYCASMESSLLMVQDLTEHNLIANWLQENVRTKSESWFTSGISDPQAVGKFLWDGYFSDLGANYLSLWIIDIEWYKDPANLYLLQGKTVVYSYNGVDWGFNISQGDLERPFICQTPKIEAFCID